MDFNAVGVQTGSSNADYAFGSLANSNTTYRIVAAGLRISYTGTELNRGGLIVGVQDPNHNSLYLSTVQSIDQQTVSKHFRVLPNWVTVLYKPVYDSDDDFVSNYAPYTPAVNDLSFFMGFIIQSPSATLSESYEYECYTVLEYQGPAVRSQTPSHFDPTGYAAAHTVSQVTTAMQPFKGDPAPVERSFLQNVDRVLDTGISYGNKLLTGIESIADSSTGRFLERMAGDAVDALGMIF